MQINLLKKKSQPIIYFLYMILICLIGIFNKNITFLCTSLTQALCLPFLFATPTFISVHIHVYLNIVTHTETYFQPEKFLPIVHNMALKLSFLESLLILLPNLPSKDMPKKPLLSACIADFVLNLPHCVKTLFAGDFKH